MQHTLYSPMDWNTSGPISSEPSPTMMINSSYWRIPSLTDQSALSDETRDLMTLPVGHGGLGIINPTRNNTSHYQWWIPFDLPQWAEGHHGWVPHWSVSQCQNWATTLTTHRQTSYTWISKHRGWGLSRRCSWQLLEKTGPCIFQHKSVQPLHTESPKYFPRAVQEKKREYDQRVREVEHGSFSPLVFSTSGGMGPTANVVYKRIASMIAQKHDKTYSKTLHCKLSYSLLCSAIMCIREARSSIHHTATSPDTMDLAWHIGQSLYSELNPHAFKPLTYTSCISIWLIEWFPR